MKIYDQTKDQQMTGDRGYVVSMVVTKFRGHQDVEIHLFRPHWDANQEGTYDWERLLGEPLRKDEPVDPEGSRRVFLETFSHAEKEALVDYLQHRYGERLDSIKVSALPLPIPLGLTPLSSVAQNERFGRIQLHNIPNYSLDFAVDGLFDLSQCSPDQTAEDEM